MALTNRHEYGGPADGNRSWSAFRRVSAWCITAALVLFAIISLVFPVHSQPTSPKAPVQTALTAEQRELVRERVRNQREQASYYRQQTAKLISNSKPKTFSQKALVDPVGLVGAIGAVLAALVALFAFFGNLAATRRHHRDTQFYEALKRFGDKDSAAARSSAAGLLAQMGQDKSRVPGWQRSQVRLVRRIWRRLGRAAMMMNAVGRPVWRRPYYATALNQLVDGLLLEDDQVVIASISDAVTQLAMAQPYVSVEKLHAANLMLQEQLVTMMAGFLRIADAGHVRISAWQSAARATSFQEDVLRVLVERPLWRAKFSLYRDELWRSPTRSHEDDSEESRAIMLVQLERVSLRLSANIHHCTLAIGAASAPSLDLSNLFLVGDWLKPSCLKDASLYGAQLQGSTFIGTDMRCADLQYSHLESAAFCEASMQDTLLNHAHLDKADLQQANLNGSIMWYAYLQGANLSRADLRGARLHGAHIDDKTNMPQVNWWAADFGSPFDQSPDLDLLEQLYQRHHADVPNDPHELHPSVLEFLTQKRLDEQVAENPEP